MNSQPTIGVYANEYLLLLELLSDIEKSFPTAIISICGGDKLEDSLPAEAVDYFVPDIESLLATDIVVLLSELPENKRNFLSKYDGTLINAAETNAPYKYDEIINIDEPILAMLENLATINDRLHVVLGLPLAIYGKDGIDALMQETRAIYTFDENEHESILPMRTAFNIHFYRNSLPNGKWEQALGKLRAMMSLDTRINPVSTVFIADVFSDSEIVLPDDLEMYEPEVDFSLEDTNRDHRIAVIKSANGHACTLIGDYYHIRTAAILGTVMNALGGSEI